MKKPLLNERERLEMQYDSMLADFYKLRLAISHLRREIERNMLKLIKSLNQNNYG